METHIPHSRQMARVIRAGERLMPPRPHVVVLVAVLAAMLICIRVFASFDDPPITSDESLYLSEAVSISHGQLTYSSGEPIIHRPPLYPATIAPVMRLSGNSVRVARMVPLLYALGAVAAVYALARSLFGAGTAAIAALLAAAADASARLSQSFYVDPAAAMWILASAAVLAGGLHTNDVPRPIATLTPRRSATIGALLGLAFLTKETSALWLPLPLLVVLLSAHMRWQWRGVVCCYGAFAVLAAPWFAWVAWNTDTVFKLDHAFSPVIMIGLAVAAGCFALGVRLSTESRRSARVLAAALIATVAFIGALYALESRPEPHAISYASAVPDWTLRVLATNVEPFALIAIAWVFAVWRLTRGDERAALPVAFGTLGTPLYVYTANRGWEVRQILPLVYVSYALLAWTVSELISALGRNWTRPQRGGVLALLVAGLLATAGIASNLGATHGASGDSYVKDAIASNTHASLSETTDASGIVDWSGPPEREIASWLRDLPAGSTVLSSRLYSTQLYVDVDARVHVRPLPTLGVTMTGDGRQPVPFGTLFRYDDAQFDPDAQRHWMYLHRYGDEPYYIGLSAEDLTGELHREPNLYLLISGDDAGFSSDSFIADFGGRPGFDLVHEYDDGDARSHLYRVHADMLADAVAWPLALRWQDFQYIATDAGREASSSSFWETLAVNGVLLDGQAVGASDLPALIDDPR